MRAKSIAIVGLLPLSLLTATPGEAQSLIGHTIYARYKDGGNSDTQIDQFYIAKNGRIYEFLGKGTTRGDVHQIGKWRSYTDEEGKRVKERISLRGNVVSWEVVGAGDFTTVYTVQGTSCTIHQTGPRADPIGLIECTVTKGQPRQ